MTGLQKSQTAAVLRLCAFQASIQRSFGVDVGLTARARHFLSADGKYQGDGIAI
jgi:hypothetical protein